MISTPSEVGDFWNFNMAVAQKNGIPKWVALESGNMETKTCGLPLRSFHSEPRHENGRPASTRRRSFLARSSALAFSARRREPSACHQQRAL